MGVVKKLAVAETNNLLLQLFRYCFVGGFAFIVDYGLLYFFAEFCSFHYLISASLSFVAGLLVNYLISTKWIFRRSKLSSKTAEFVIFAVIGVIGLFLTDVLMFLFTDVLKIHFMVSKLMAAAIVLLWNFIGRKYILFNK